MCFSKNMEELEVTVQKHVVNFCRILPSHVDRWRNILQDAVKPAEALSNYAEQLRHVERANIKYLEDFPTLQDDLQYKIRSEIECELSILKSHIMQLHQVNQDTKNKLSSLERLTVDLNWESKSELIRGCALQPPLSKILQEGLSFWLYFAAIMKSINERFKNLDIRDRKSVSAFENSFKVDLNNKVVNCLLAITQYVNNDKSLI